MHTFTLLETAKLYYTFKRTNHHQQSLGVLGVVEVMRY